MNSHFFVAKSQRGPKVMLACTARPHCLVGRLHRSCTLRLPGSLPYRRALMHPAILAIALGTQLTVQVSDNIPTFNSERTCTALSETGLKSDPSYKDCLDDE